MPGMFRHAARSLRLGVHVDDLLVTGERADLLWLQARLREAYELKTQLIGPGPEDEKVTAYLNRTLTWTPDGLLWTPNAKHLKKLQEMYGLASSNVVSMPITAENLKPVETPALDPAAATKYRCAAATINFLAQDRPDLSVSACVCSTRMSACQRFFGLCKTVL